MRDVDTQTQTHTHTHTHTHSDVYTHTYLAHTIFLYVCCPHAHTQTRPFALSLFMCQLDGLYLSFVLFLWLRISFSNKAVNPIPSGTSNSCVPELKHTQTHTHTHIHTHTHTFRQQLNKQLTFTCMCAGELCEL